MAKSNPFTFIQEVRAEAAKVTWPTYRETVVSSIMVIIMSIVAAIFFYLADQVLSTLVRAVLGLGS